MAPPAIHPQRSGDDQEDGVDTQHAHEGSEDAVEDGDQDGPEQSEDNA